MRPWNLVFEKFEGILSSRMGLCLQLHILAPDAEEAVAACQLNTLRLLALLHCIRMDLDSLIWDSKMRLK